MVEEAVRLPDGRQVEGFTRLVMPDFACVVPLTGDGRLLMLRHYKHGPRAVVWGVPAGHLERGEKPLAAAKRELLEETGHAARRWEALGCFVVNGNRGAGRGHLFLARSCRRVAAPSAPDLEEAELHLLAPRRAWAFLYKRGALTMGTALALALARLRISR